jgi:catechol 2,3-dioxygenase-like lactoylglutathione lyase family enzyme
MNQQLVTLALVVPDYDEAIAYYSKVLGFTLLEDEPRGPGKRWVRVKPPGVGGASLLLAKAATPEQHAAIGNQTGGRVFLFLHTDNFQRDYDRYRQAGVAFTEEPRHESYGTVAVFRDLYGNKWDLIEAR